MNVKEVFKRKIAVKTKYSIHGAVDRKTAAQVNSRQFLPPPPNFSKKTIISNHRFTHNRFHASPIHIKKYLSDYHRIKTGFFKIFNLNNAVDQTARLKPAIVHSAQTGCFDGQAIAFVITDIIKNLNSLKES